MKLAHKLFISVFILIVATVPWFYSGEASAEDTGLPNWFIYSLIMSVAFSIFISIAMGLFWDRLAGEETVDHDPSKED